LAAAAAAAALVALDEVEAGATAVAAAVVVEAAGSTGARASRGAGRLSSASALYQRGGISERVSERANGRQFCNILDRVWNAQRCQAVHVLDCQVGFGVCQSLCQFGGVVVADCLMLREAARSAMAVSITLLLQDTTQ
jgi:hypothetical protein